MHIGNFLGPSLVIELCHLEKYTQFDSSTEVKYYQFLMFLK